MAASLVLLLTSAQAQAQQVSSDEAMTAARRYLLGSNSRRAKAQAENPLTLAYTSRLSGKNNFYVFNSTAEDGGYVIVGADQAASEILAYVPSGSFNIDSAPDNVKWWLAQYEQQISQAIVASASSSEAAPRKASTTRSNIDNMLKTKWNQSWPYNSQLPNIGYSGNNALATGCVATAMSQVMYYHQWPVMGTDSITYEHEWRANDTITCTADFARTEYDWANMKTAYSGNENASDPSAIAVGTLMYHAGVAVNASYGQIATGGTSASVADVMPALIRHFGYDKSGLVMQRDYYTNEEWEDKIYSELEAKRPVIYTGSSNGAGHAFIISGYRNLGGLFYINWGWGGNYDGFFAITGANALKPSGSGIGGVKGAAYTDKQEIVTNIMPDNGGDYELVVNCYDTYSISATPSQNDVADNIVIDRTQPGADLPIYLFNYPMNFTVGEASFNYGVLFRETTTGKETIKTLTEVNNLGTHGYIISSPSFSTDILPFNGIYEVYPVYSPKDLPDDWAVMRQKGNIVPTITVVGGTNDEKVFISFDISDTDVQVARTINITCNPTYTGEVSYKSSNEAIATVDEHGVVKGISQGSVTITAIGEGDDRFYYTSRDFDITVSRTVKNAVDFTISTTALSPGLTATISHTKSYTGKITYLSSNPEVATVDEKGVISALTVGVATISVEAESTATFKKSAQNFKITVKQPTTIPEGEIVIAELPTFGNNDYVSASSCTLPIVIYNGTDKTSGSFRVYAAISSKTFATAKYLTLANLPAGETYTWNLDLTSMLSYFTEGETYTINFCHNYTMNMETFEPEYVDPYNFAAITFKYVKDTSVKTQVFGNRFSTICLPFDAKIPHGVRAYECATLDEEGVAQITQVESLLRNTPYLLRGDTERSITFSGPDAATDMQAAYNGMLIGVLSDDFSINANQYILQYNQSTYDHSIYAFWRSGTLHEGETAEQYTCLLQVPTVYDETGNDITVRPDHIVLPLTVKGDNPQAINSVTLDSNSRPAAIYSLSGIRRTSLQPGVNIIRMTDGTVRKVYQKR